jgi:hypothetical protein
MKAERVAADQAAADKAAADQAAADQAAADQAAADQAAAALKAKNFFNTSESAKLLKPDHSNKIRVGVLGVIEAIGRAILLPFVVIAQFFIALIEDEQIVMRPYMRTFSAPFVSHKS